MNEARIEQCKKDIEVLQKELAKLEKGIPIISFATLESKNDRVVINFSEKMLKTIRNNNNLKQLVITPHGGCADLRNDFKPACLYSNQIPLFGELI